MDVELKHCGQAETVSYQTVAGAGGQTQIRIVKKEPPQVQPQPQYKIMNPDGTLSDIPASSQPQQVAQFFNVFLGSL